MAQQFTLRVRVTDGGDIEGIRKALAGLGATVSATERKTRSGNKANQEFYDTQKKGVIGTANSTKSFSKLAETIGGNSSGLVAAYATLAANAFAVSAAFNALRSASQVEQIFRGLEAAGVRVGRSLTGTARGLKEVTGSAISTEQAMRSTAQIVSAGFNNEAVTRLGQAARDTSFALGRNMTDALDRLTRGIVKLEPELLDELGIMTKLTESNTNYARELGKTEGQLTNFERRQGFMNAVLAEAELKFGGLSAAAGDSTAYDKLAAKVSDTTNSILNSVNLLAKPIANVLSGSSLLLGGVALSFAASLRNQLIPGLANAAANAAKSAQAFRDTATAKTKAIEATRRLAAAEATQALESKKNFAFVDRMPKKYSEVADAVRKGTASLEEQRAALVSLEKSHRANQVILDNNPAFAAGTAKGNAKLAEQQKIQQEIQAIKELQAARVQADNTDIANSARVVAARREAKIASREALAQQASAASIGAASQLQLAEAWKQLSLSVRAYASAQALAATDGISLLGRLRIAAFAASAAVKTIGVAFLTALPYIGLAVTAVGLISSAIDSLKSDRIKAVEKATEDLGEATSNTAKYIAELERINNSTAASHLRAAQSITVQSNAIAEITDKFEDLIVASRLADKAVNESAGESWAKAFRRNFTAQGNAANNLGLDVDSRAIKAAQGIASIWGDMNDDPVASGAVKTLDSLIRLAPEATERVVALHGGWRALEAEGDKVKFAKKVRDISREVNSTYQSASQNVTDLQESFKALDNSISDFMVSSNISTPFDQMVKGFDAVSDSIARFSIASSSGNFDGNWQDMLQGMGESVNRFLTVTTKQRLDMLRGADQELQKLKQNKEVNAQRIQQQQELVALYRDQFLSAAQSELTIAQDRLIIAQRDNREMASRLNLLAAIVESNKRIYEVAGSGLKARLAREKEIRDLQKAQISNQMAIQRGMLATAEARLQELYAAVQVTKQLDLQLVRQRELSQEQRKAELSRRGINNPENLTRGAYLAARPGDTATADLIAAYNAEARLNLRERLAEAEENRRAYKAQEALVRDQRSSLQAQANALAALSAQDLTREQERALIEQNRIQFNNTLYDTLGKQRQTLIDTANIYRDIEDINGGISDTLSFQLRAIQRTSAAEREALETGQRSQLAALQAARRVAEADANKPNTNNLERQAARDALTDLDSQIRLTQQQYDIDLGRVNAQERLNIAQKVSFDARREGLSWQQESFSLLQRELETQREISDQLTRGNELLARQRVLRRGVDLTDRGQQAQEIATAREAYKLAIQESSVRKAMIDLEYALLDAQRSQLAEDLRARRDFISEADPRYAQLTSTIERLESINVERIAASAKRAVDLSIENAQRELQTAMGTRTRGGVFAGMIAAVEDMRELQRQRQAAMEPVQAAREQSVVIANNIATRTATEISSQATTPLIQSNNGLITAIQEWMNRIETLNRVPQTSVDSTLTGGGRGRQAADFFMRRLGLTANQAAGLAGNLQVESGFNPRAIGDGGKAHGIAQWHPDRQANFRREMGKEVLQATFDEQLEFIAREMEKYETRALQMLRASTSTRESALAVSRYYERPNIRFAHNDRRVASAESLVGSAAHAAPVAPVPSEVPESIEEIVIVAKRAEDTIAQLAISLDRLEVPKINLGAANRDRTQVIKDSLVTLDDLTAHTVEALNQLGPDGEMVTAVYQGMSQMTSNVIFALESVREVGFSTAQDFGTSFAAIASVVSGALSTIQAATSASARAKEEAIDREIAAEQKRDGKSAESLAKIQAMEKRKDQVAKKQFETNKKMMMAQAVIGTATGVALALGSGPFPANVIMAGIIGAMGAAQLAIISGTQYQSAIANSASAEPPSTVSIGKRGDSVDLARQNTNVGGELGYLRGSQGYGNNASNYSVIGSAYGGDVPRGYGPARFMFGEKGPEPAVPKVPLTVTPADKASEAKQINATFQISTLDSSGVEDILLNQRGNIISMLREAANANGATFMEDVNTANYSRPNSTGSKL